MNANPTNFHPVERLTGAPSFVLPIVFGDGVPVSVADFGCNCGEWLLSCWQFGVQHVVGVDGDNMLPWLQIPARCFVSGNLTKPIDLGVKFKLAICLEVAEHLPAESAVQLVQTVTGHSDRVLWSAAVPGQGGFGHINCQPSEYWRELFGARGFMEDTSLNARIRDLPIPSYYANNITQYRRAV